MPHVTSLGADDPRRVGRYRLAGRISGMPASGPVYLANSVDGDQVTVTLLGSDLAADGAARAPSADETSPANAVEGDEVTVPLLGSDWPAGGAARDRFADEAASGRRVPPFCAASILD